MNHARPAALLGIAFALALALSPTAALAHDGHHEGHHDGDHGRHHAHTVLRDDLTPSLPTDPAINGVQPGGLPWVLARGEVRVRDDGRIDVRIEGLQVSRNGSADNPVPSIDAVVYSDGRQVADSGPYPLSIPDGDARFRAHVRLPRHLHDVSVLISPSTAVGAAYIASAAD